MTKYFQLRVTLIEIEPEIWRRVVLPDTLTLLELHAVLQGAMGWRDYHLHRFEINDKKYELPECDDLGMEDGFLDERDFTLKKVFKDISDFTYRYDFGDNWTHRIEVENASPDIPSEMHGPFCIGGENACPPEDCGGVYDYPDFLTSLKNKKHPRYAETKEWIGSFDPTEFSVSQATALILAIMAIYRGLE